jgi:hypothetical protein
MARCWMNPSMLCEEQSGCCFGDYYFLDQIQMYLLTDTLKSGGFEPILSYSSEISSSQERTMVKRADIACCIDNEPIMRTFFQTGRVNRQTCQVFQTSGDKFRQRMTNHAKAT